MTVVRSSLRPRIDVARRSAQGYGSQGRARRVPDQVVGQGSSRLLADRLIGLPTWVGACGARDRKTLRRKGSAVQVPGAPFARERRLSRRWARKAPTWVRAALLPGRLGRAGQPDLGDQRPDRALAQRTGHGDSVVPVQHVVAAAASVELDRVHPAAGSDLGGDSLEPRPHVIGRRPEPAVKTPRRLHRAGNLADRNHRLTRRPEAAGPFILQPPPAWPAPSGAAGHLAQHGQAVAAGWTAEQPTGHLGPVRPPPSAVKIIAGVLLNQSGTHAPGL
jgi:hypothetical protein